MFSAKENTLMLYSPQNLCHSLQSQLKGAVKAGILPADANPKLRVCQNPIFWSPINLCQPTLILPLSEPRSTLKKTKKIEPLIAGGY